MFKNIEMSILDIRRNYKNKYILAIEVNIGIYNIILVCESLNEIYNFLKDEHNLNDYFILNVKNNDKFLYLKEVISTIVASIIFSLLFVIILYVL